MAFLGFFVLTLVSEESSLDSLDSSLFISKNSSNLEFLDITFSIRFSIVCYFTSIIFFSKCTAVILDASALCMLLPGKKTFAFLFFLFIVYIIRRLHATQFSLGDWVQFSGESAGFRSVQSHNHRLHLPEERSLRRGQDCRGAKGS